MREQRVVADQGVETLAHLRALGHVLGRTIRLRGGPELRAVARGMQRAAVALRMRIVQSHQRAPR